jgi:hypothetical protein
MDGLGIKIWQAEESELYPIHNVQTGSEAHVVSYCIRIADLFLGGLKRQERETEQPLLSSVKVKNGVTNASTVRLQEVMFN